MNNKSLLSINVGLSFAFSFVAIITSVCISGVLFFNMHSVMYDDLNKRMHDIAAIGVSKIDGDAHSLLTKPEQEGGEAYNKIKKTLQDIRNGGTGIRYVYTMRYLSSNKYEFVVDAEEDMKNISHLGDEFTEINIDPAFDVKNKIYINDRYYTDKWGTWLSGYAQIYTSGGKLDGILAVDISAESIIRQERKIIVNILIVETFITLFVIGLGMIIARRISNPLAQLEKDMLRIKEFKLDDNVDIKSRFREIINIKNAEGNMKAGLRSFKKYVSADLVSQLIRMNKEARLGGEKKELTVFFSDIADFVAVSENLSPEQLSKYMAEYFEGITSIIIRHSGTVDKYIGDAVMAFWGAPSELNDHAYKASLAALECQEFLEKMNARHARAGEPQFHTRIGINSGNVIVGNFGYEERFNYTVLGDNVNLASRLEGINKLYGTKIIVSESTYGLIRDKIRARKIDVVVVKGKKTGMPIYELVGLVDKLTEEEKSFISLFNEGMELYLHKKWGEAILVLQNGMRIMPNDKPAQIIIGRCRNLIENPPPDNWRGVTVLTEK
jgi:class 3 adenylate cyclase